ncbi:MAG: hypothetical protein HC803_02980 [Saprospiraceae bacterium]|nr:hypothetical protein [Saprospiraceae bacterium]
MRRRSETTKQMKEKGLMKYIAYLPDEYLKINGVKSRFGNWQVPITFLGFRHSRHHRSIYWNTVFLFFRFSCCLGF